MDDLSLENNMTGINSLSLSLWFKYGSMKRLLFQFQCVTWKLEKALAGLPYDDFEISEEVLEQVSTERFHAVIWSGFAYDRRHILFARLI